MNAFRLGPVVMSAPRFYAVLALVVLLVLGEVLARSRRRPEVASWAWGAALVVVIAARLGFVLENVRAFLPSPWRIVAFWQGGFSPWWGVLAAAAFTGLRLRRSRAGFRTALVPAAAALATWLLVPLILSPAAPATTRLPTAALDRLDDDPLRLSDLQGQPVVINLWATWCPPCRRELPMLASAAASNTDVHFVFADQGEPEATVRAYLEREGLELGVVVLDEGTRLSQWFGVLGFPTTLFFDASGRLVATQVGEISPVTLINHLGALRR